MTAGPQPPPSSAETTAVALSALILDGTLAPGRPVRESAVAVEQGVSRNTVREAVRILERSGLVAIERNRGAIVRAPSPERTLDLYAARAALEVGAVRTANLRGAAAPVGTAFEALEAACEGQDREAIVAADLALHTTLVALAGSERLDALFADVCVELRLYLNLGSVVDREYLDGPRIVDEHRDLVRAARHADREVLSALLADHIRSNGDRVAAILSTGV